MSLSDKIISQDRKFFSKGGAFKPKRFVRVQDLQATVKGLKEIFITGKWEAEHIKEIIDKEFGVKLSHLTGQGGENERV